MREERTAARVEKLAVLRLLMSRMTGPCPAWLPAGRGLLPEEERAGLGGRHFMAGGASVIQRPVCLQSEGLPLRGVEGVAVGVAASHSYDVASHSNDSSPV